MTISERAKELAKQFETAKRDTGESYVRIKDDAPDRALLLDMIGGSDISWESSYAMTEELLDAIADCDADDWDEIQNENICDNLIDVSTSSLVSFIAEGGNHSWADEAMTEYGPFDSFDNLLMTAQRLAYENQLAAITDNWPDAAGESSASLSAAEHAEFIA